MLEFQKLTYDSLPCFEGRLAKCDCRVSANTPLCKLMWDDFYHAEFSFLSGCLIWKNVIFGKVYFSYPMAVEDVFDERKALTEIENYCVEKYIPLAFIDVTQEQIAVLVERYRYMDLSDNRNYEEYLFVAEDFRTFSGKKYAGQRNHINKFRSLYPQARFRYFTSVDKEPIELFFKEFIKENHSAEKKKEILLAKKIITSLPIEKHSVGGFVLDNKILSIVLGSRMGDTLFIHIEKGLKKYEGIYTATANAFATAERDAEFINREDDSGLRGLRISKTQYHPYRMIMKFVVRVKNEWENVRKFPVLKTERLTLDAIKKSDAKDYFDLCCDDERNIYWGYDYKKDLKEDLYPEYFYDVQKKDLSEKMCFSFAVRKDGKMIGEGVLYRFTGTGQAEAGMRIASEYAGNGYGREAFSALVDWALYGLGLTKVVSKCYHQNKASFAMLSSKMKMTGTDETFTYFAIEL